MFVAKPASITNLQEKVLLFGARLHISRDVRWCRLALIGISVHPRPFGMRLRSEFCGQETHSLTSKYKLLQFWNAFV